MPRDSTPSPVKHAVTSVSYGQVIEFITEKLYLASYTHAPNAQTPFPWPLNERSSSKSPKRSSHRSSHSVSTKQSGTQKPIVYFSIDDSLLYNAFHADFGPLHIGHLYRFAVTLHEVLAQNPDRMVVFWCYADSRSKFAPGYLNDADLSERANAACILAAYMVLIQNWPPHLALAPIAQMDPPCMPFRDAGYSIADYGLTIQDVVYGVWRAKEEKLIALDNFSLEEYETFEQVQNGDFNWVTPSFIALASPQDEIRKPIPTSDPKHATLPRTVEDIQNCQDLPAPFQNVLSYFCQRNVGLIVRLNDPLYSPTFFTVNGIQHLDMIFDDGTCPTLPMVRKFIRLAHDMITIKKKSIAVHCKAGLGRTGCLIGAYLIYRHGFTANEVIAFMRFMRPGMVVGPQQHWLHLNQNIFREWWFEDTIKAKLMAEMQPATPPRPSLRKSVTTPQVSGQKRPALEEIHSNDQSPAGGAITHTNGNEENVLPAPTPGQPRKTSKTYGKKRQSENEPFILPDAEIVSMERHIHHELPSGSEDELQVHMLVRKASRSPGSALKEKRRAVSCTTTVSTGVRKASGRVGSMGMTRAK